MDPDPVYIWHCCVLVLCCIVQTGLSQAEFHIHFSQMNSFLLLYDLLKTANDKTHMYAMLICNEFTLNDWVSFCDRKLQLRYKGIFWMSEGIWYCSSQQAVQRTELGLKAVT